MALPKTCDVAWPKPVPVIAPAAPPAPSGCEITLPLTTSCTWEGAPGRYEITVPFAAYMLKTCMNHCINDSHDSSQDPSTRKGFFLKGRLIFFGFSLPSTRIRWKWSLKTHLSKNAWKRRLIVFVWMDEMERKSSKECSAYFLWTNERFRKLNGEALGLFWDNQGSEVLKEISGHSVLYGQGNYVFKWKILYYYCIKFCSRFSFRER